MNEKNYMIIGNRQVEKINVIIKLYFLIEESIITDKIAQLRTNQIRVILSL